MVFLSRFVPALLALMVVPQHSAHAQEGRSVRCESRGERYEYCRTHMTGRVRLQRQLSDAPCRQYETWGADRDGGGIWVDQGCRGIFFVEPWFSSGAGAGGEVTLKCESQGGRYRYCPTNARGRVRLLRQLSAAPCRQDETWGADRGGVGIWVDRGCHGEFRVEHRRQR
ncbi:MAG: DUF3011 domain-containing protein [Candidatus Binatia bacterium]|nr:DUF3011 domain-containing protein [Candidatus Binatia bacterium]